MQQGALLDGLDAPATQLRSADPADWPVHAGWQPLVEAFFTSSNGQALCDFLSARLATQATIYPPQPLHALALTPLSAVRVVVLGQDPYHARGQAHGLAFSVPAGVRVPPSLRNIFKEVAQSTPDAQTLFPLSTGSLLTWAQHGVLLLNTCLTVEDAHPASHTGRGWEVLTDQIIQTVSNTQSAVVFMLWGAHAQSKRSLIDTSKHCILAANHPSPLSATRPPIPFIGCAHFSQAAQWLSSRTSLA